MNNELVLQNLNNRKEFSLLKDYERINVTFDENCFNIQTFSHKDSVYEKKYENVDELVSFLNSIFGPNLDSYIISIKAKTKLKKIKKERIGEIDFIRGVLIIMMWVDHFNYVLWGLIPELFKIPYNSEVREWINNASTFWDSDWRFIVRNICLFLFLFISGISCCLTRSNLKRGLKVTGVALIMTGGSFVITKYILKMSLSYGVFFYFGAIACLGVSALIFSLFEFIIKKLLKYENEAKYIYLSFGIVFICIGLFLNTQSKTVPYISPEFLLEDWNWLKAPIGLVQTSDDWMPLFPYLGYFFVGAFFGEIFYKKNRKSLILKPKLDLNRIDNASSRFWYSTYEIGNTFVFKPINSIVEFTGRNTIWVYMFHQVINIGILVIILLAKGYQFSL